MKRRLFSRCGASAIPGGWAQRARRSARRQALSPVSFNRASKWGILLRGEPIARAEGASGGPVRGEDACTLVIAAQRLQSRGSQPCHDLVDQVRNGYIVPTTRGDFLRKPIECVELTLAQRDMI
eukprot:161595-Prorocentrum_minimum.AAC.3